MNSIRELKQQEKYKNMLKRKNKEKKIYKDKNASLQFEKQKLYIALLNREKEIDRLHSIIKEVREYIEKYDFITGYYEYNYDDGNDTYTHYTIKEELLEIVKDSDKE